MLGHAAPESHGMPVSPLHRESFFLSLLNCMQFKTALRWRGVGEEPHDCISIHIDALPYAMYIYLYMNGYCMATMSTAVHVCVRGE